MSGFLGVFGAIPDCDLPASAPRGRAAERVLAAELLQEFRRLTQVTTEYGERLAHGAVNHVLEVGTYVLPDTGYLARSFAVTTGSVEVRNLSQHDLTVVSAAPGIAAPSGGIGVYIVPAGSTALINLASHDLTIWGTAADKFSYQVFTQGGLAAPSLSSVDGGGA